MRSHHTLQLRASRIVGIASGLFWLGCSSGGAPMPSDPTWVNVPAGGSQGSNASGSGTGTAGQQPAPPVTVDAGMSAEPPHVGPPAPTDASTPAMLDASGDDNDAGPWVPPDPTCSEGVWQLAPGFLVSRHVDYVADRNSVLPHNAGFFEGEPPTLSSAGMACATATDQAKCRAGLALPNTFGRHLVTTEGDNVRIWTGPASRTLLGLLDTPSEALWFATANGPYVASCSTKISPSDGGYLIDEVVPSEGCYTNGEIPPILSVFVQSKDGSVFELPSDAGQSLCGTRAF